MPKVSKDQNQEHRGGNRWPPAGTREHALWKKRVAAGMRKAKAQRRKAGILSVVQIAVEFDLPPAFTKRAILHAADTGELKIIWAGRRPYVRREDAERLFGTEGSAAA
jgi:hypothetical protein